MTSRLPSYRWRALHLTALWAYGVTQPVMSLIDGNHELLVDAGASRADTLLFVILIALVPPLAATGYAWLASRLSKWVGDIVYLVMVGAFVAPLALYLVKQVDPTGLAALAAVVTLSVLGAFAYARMRAARLFLGYSIILPIAGLLLFVRGLPSLSDEAQAAGISVRDPHPVVVLVLDEMPVSSLMTAGGDIDSIRYPNFGRLAREATWYRNATTVHDSTAAAVPAILTGRTENTGPLVASNYSENLFTLVGDSFELKVHEAFSRLCPRDLCPDVVDSTSTLTTLTSRIRDLYLTRTLPTSLDVSYATADLDLVLESASDATVGEFDLMLDEMRSDQRGAALYYAHLYLPHAPWRFLPSGVRYPFHGIDGWQPTEYWLANRWLVLQGFQRHLLQVGYTDVLVGRLLDRLDRVGLYDRALVVVVADHGASFRPSGGRRPITQANAADIANVPLFVKYPGQKRGRVDLRAARTVDILPTIAERLGIALPWTVDGSSLLGRAGDSSPRDEIVVGREVGGTLSTTIGQILAGRAETLRLKTAAFGSGEASLYELGRHKRLLGIHVARPWRRDTRVSIAIENADSFETVRLGSGFLPARIFGVVEDGDLEPGAELAVAVNGRIRSLTKCFEDGGKTVFRALVPETAFAEGSNRVDVFAVRSGGTGIRLVWVGSSA